MESFQKDTQMQLTFEKESRQSKILSESLILILKVKSEVGKQRNEMKPYFEVFPVSALRDVPICRGA